MLKLVDPLLHVPNITKTLIFVLKFSKVNHIYFEFHSNGCFMKSQACNLVLFEVFLDGSGPYCFKNLNVEPLRSKLSHNLKALSHVVYNITVSNKILNIVQVNALADNKLSIWHSMLGHANSRAIHNMLQLCNIYVSNKKYCVFCNSYCLCKSHRLDSPLSNTKYNILFQLVHTDMWGPSPAPSRSGYLYYIIFVYSFSRYMWIYMLNPNSDTLYAFKLF